MKKINTGILMILALICVLFLPANTSAQITNSTEVNARVNLKTDIKTNSSSTNIEKREDRKEKIEEKRDSKLIAVKDRIEKHGENMVRRFNAMVERLEKIALRIEARIKILSDDGFDTTEAEASLSLAKEEIDEAKKGMEKVPESLTDALTKDVLRGSFSDIRALIVEVKTHLKAGHSHLVRSITEIKGLRSGQSEETKVKVDGSVEAETVQ